VTFGSSVITSGMGIPFHNPRYIDEIFPLTTHTFEGYQLPVPHDADAHLRHIYGNYMQLPDLSKLKPHVGQIEIYE
jgi:lipopolysaccharide cholinephosphotransferase